MHAKSDVKKSVRQAIRIGKTNTKSMSALLQHRVFRAKIDEKSHVFRDVDFEGILGGLWETKIYDFRFFVRCFFDGSETRPGACNVETRAINKPEKSV